MPGTTLPARDGQFVHQVLSLAEPSRRQRWRLSGGWRCIRVGGISMKLRMPKRRATLLLFRNVEVPAATSLSTFGKRD
jgi:hypothetical protein